MQPQQTDVLGVDGPAVAPSIIEGATAPTSPIVLADELFGDTPVITGPVAIVEPTFEKDQPTDVLTPAAEASEAAPVAVETDHAASGTAELTPSAAADSDDVTPETEAPSSEPPAKEAADEVQPSDPEPTDDGASDEDAALVRVTGPVERVEPPKPDLEFTLEQLEAATPGAEKTAPAEPASTDDASPWGAAEVNPSAMTDVASAAVVPTSAPDASSPAEQTHAKPNDAEDTAAPTKTATYDEIMNSQQEFVGAIKTKKFPLIDPDQFWVMVAAVVALGTILAANLTASFTSVYAMAAYTGLPKSVQAVPVVALDFAIVGFSWALMVFGARGDKVWSTRLYLFVVTGFSVVANFMHTYTHWKGDLSSPEAIFGVVFSSAVPLFSLVATEELIRLVFIRRNRRKTKKAVA